MVMCLGQGADVPMAQLMPLPLTISCSSKSRLVLPSWFYLSGVGSPGYSRTKCKRATKWLCVCAHARVCVLTDHPEESQKLSASDHQSLHDLIDLGHQQGELLPVLQCS